MIQLLCIDITLTKLKTSAKGPHARSIVFFQRGLSLSSWDSGYIWIHLGSSGYIGCDRNREKQRNHDSFYLEVMTRHAPLEASWSQTFAMAEHPLTKLKQLKVENALAKPLKIKLGFTESKMHRCFELLSSSQTLGKEPLIMPVATPKAHSC